VSDRKLLGIYLNDHLAGATASVELVRRARGANEGSDYGDFLARLADDLAADRQALRDVMSELDVGADRAKVAAGWAAEKAGRLKLNGRLRGYSPLSRVVELEGLTFGVTGTLMLWRSLRDLAEGEPRLDAARLDRLTERAERQLAELDGQRLRASREALRAKIA
jgi:hypothetical protein